MSNSSSSNSTNSGSLDTVMTESRLFPPTKEFADKARIPSYEAYEKLWNEAAAIRLALLSC